MFHAFAAVSKLELLDEGQMAYISSSCFESDLWSRNISRSIFIQEFQFVYHGKSVKQGNLLLLLAMFVLSLLRESYCLLVFNIWDFILLSLNLLVRICSLLTWAFNSMPFCRWSWHIRNGWEDSQEWIHGIWEPLLLWCIERLMDSFSYIFATPREAVTWISKVITIRRFILVEALNFVFPKEMCHANTFCTIICTICLKIRYVYTINGPVYRNKA